MSTNDAITNYLNLIEQLVHQKTGQSLTNVQRLVLGECLQPHKRTYGAIAKDNNYSGSYIKQRVAPDLWHLLSELVGTNVTKVNCKSVLFAYLDRAAQLKEQTQSASSQSINPQSIDPQSINQQRTHINSSQLARIEDSDELVPSRPLPFEFPMESVPLSSPYYIQRNPHEQQCYQLITRPGALIRIKAPRQMGKTSLMLRIVSQVKDYASIILNFQQTEQSILTNLEKLLRWICANISRQLNLPSAINDYWDEDIGNKMSCTLYLKDYVLEKIDTPVVLVLEESSELFNHEEVAKEFFGMLRTWHEYTRHNEEWKKLRLILIQSTETYIQLNANQSPFNVGFEVALSPFSVAQVQTLAARNGLEFSEQSYAQLMSLLSGHPYLVRLAFYHLANKSIDWDILIETASTDEGIFKHHLQRHLWQLQQYSQLCSAFQSVLAHDRPIQIGQAEGFKLNSMGLITLEGNQVQISCDLYREYFIQHLNESRAIKGACQ